MTTDTLTAEEKLDMLRAAYARGEVRTLLPLLPLLKVDGRPMVQTNHYQFEPVYKIDMPRSTMLMCARQCGKSVSIVTQSLLTCPLVPFFHTLFVQPRFDQMKKFSNNYLSRFIKDSVFIKDLLDPTGEQSIQQKSFKNGSNIYLSFAFLDPERIRGMTAARVVVDEVASIQYDFLPVIEEVTSAQLEYGFMEYTGTPTTTNNTAAVLFSDSSQAEWHIKCGCGKENIPNVANDAYKMIGAKTVICAKCGKPLDVATGMWVHHYSDRRNVFEGYHLPQIIHPLHANHGNKWSVVLKKKTKYTETRFKNEVLGEPSDEGAKPITEADIRACSNHLDNSLSAAIEYRKKLDAVVVGVDWSGHGELEDSTTTIAVIGALPGDERVHVIYLERLPPMKPEDEARKIVNICMLFAATYLAHDFTGAGMIRETTVAHLGYPTDRLIPFNYVFAPVSKRIINFFASEGHRSCYNIDKTRSLMVLFEMIRRQKITLPDYEHAKDLLRDLLHLIQETRTSPRGADFTLMVREPKQTDDIAHSINFGCSTIWHTRGQYPNLVPADEKLSPEEVTLMNPERVRWS